MSIMRLKVTDNLESFKWENQNEAEFNSCFLEFKNELKNEINSKFEWTEGEIEVSIESLKAKLDDIHQSFKTKLQKSKNKVEK